MQRTENQSLYALEGLASILVLEIHAPISAYGGVYLYNFARCAVPIFFLISGYFSYYEDENEAQNKIKKKIERNIQLFLICACIYVPLNIVLHSDDISSLLASFIAPSNLFYLLVCNWTTPYFGCGHLWFVLALIYSYCMLAGLLKFHQIRIGYFFSIAALVIVYIVEILNQTNHLGLREIYYRNAFFIGFPLIMIGNVMGKLASGGAKRCNMRYLHYFLLIALVLLVVETKLFENSFYLTANSLLFSVIALVVCVQNPNLVNSSNILSFMGRKCSKWFYAFHYAVILILSRMGLQGNRLFFIMLLMYVAYILITKYVISRKNNYVVL